MSMNDGERRNCEFQRGSMDPTSFFYLLLRAIYKADMMNRTKLKLGFWDEVEAVERWISEDGYAEKIMDEYKTLKETE